MGYVLGLDLGTSSLKGLLVNKQGEVVTTVTAEYPLIHLKPGYSEQDPVEWVKACDEVMLSLSEKVNDFTEKLEGISFSGQMHSLVLLDKNAEVLRPAILWNDVRNSDECEKINTEFGEEILRITKNIAREGFTLPKILWIQKHEPEIWEQVDQVLLPKDYLRYYLTGKFNMDYSDAAGTLMLDIEDKNWSEEVVSNYGINLDVLPPLVGSADYVGDVLEDLKSKYGLKNDVKVFAGGADNACAAVGSGILDESTGMASIGTSGVFLSYEESHESDYEGQLHVFNHAADDQSYYSMGVTLAAGHSLNWFKNTFLADKTFDEALANIGDINPGSNGLLFTPYIVGERTPYTDGKIRGSFIGIDTSHTIDHFTRSVIEGITFSLKDSQYLMENVAKKNFERIISVGGGSKNKDWLQIQADIFDTDIVTLTADQGPGLGATMLAAVGLNWFDSMDECSQVFVEYADTIKPIKENVEIYKRYYEEYRKIYSSTKEISHNLNEIIQ